MKILLVGNQNVGKSTLFSRLTGINVVTSNYPGTTVEFKEGKMKFGRKTADVIDVPGTYDLEPTSRAEEVAVKMLKEGDIVINVVDATNLERNLFLTFQLMERNIPMIVALNFWNETKHRGIEIDVKKLEEMLKVPVVPTTALTGEGVKKLVSRLKEAVPHSYRNTDKEKWAKIGEIIKKTQKIRQKDHTLMEHLEDITIKPLTGIPFAIAILLLIFEVVRIIGETLIAYIFDPLFNLYTPVAMYISSFLGQGLLHDILIGNLINGQIDYVQSMGVLTTGLYVPIAMVLPYILAFYFVLGILEDSGYLPRLATLVDTIMHKIGMHGIAIVPMVLGMGCNVPGALSARILETKRQRFIASTLMAIAVPCMAQTAMIFGLLGRYGITALVIVYGTLFIVWVILGITLNKIMKGGTPETFLELPNYRMPCLTCMNKKLFMRMRSFLQEAIPLVLVGVFIVNLLYVFGVIDIIGNITAPLVVNVLGLPKEAIASLVMGFLRKDVAIGMLLPLNLTMKQLIIASTVLAMYFPCIATFVVLFRELGLRDLIKSSAIMVSVAILVGGLLNLIL